jgi:LacI family repressor for deo operon, udp, cdd, tsx, nupC, and nupG
MNIKKIAEICGYSVATVSRVINDDSRVAASTRKKVLSVIDKYNFVPNITGRSLRTQKSNRILVLLPTMANQFYTTIIQGIEDTADEHGYATLVAVSNLEESKELKYLHMLRMNHVDGCISFFNTLDADYITQLSKKYPFVQCCELTIGADVSHVVIDNEKAIYDVTSEFIENNHKTIAFISGNYYKYSEISRESGFIKAHLDHNLKLDKSLIVKSFYRYTDGAEAVKKIFSRDKTPTAIVCASDSLALGAISELKRMEINVGEEVMVIGFDDTSITEFYKPSISSVSQPRYELGKEAFDLIFQKLNNIDATNKKVILPHRIIHRESTGY